MINYSGTWNIDLGWLAWIFSSLPLAIVVALVAFVLTRPANRQAAAARSGSQLEIALTQAVAQLKSSGSAPIWTPPLLPYSVMACVWTQRLIGRAGESVYGANRDYTSSLRLFNWQYRADTPYIIAAALLSLRDSGLITISLRQTSPFNALSALHFERTDVAVPSGDPPLVEAGLLTACEDLALNGFFKTTTPGTQRLVREFVKHGSGNSFKWVFRLAVHQARQLGLCEPSRKPRDDKPAYSLEHLAACDEQVVAFAARWREFATNEPEIQQRLLTEAAFALRSGSA